MKKPLRHPLPRLADGPNLDSLDTWRCMTPGQRLDRTFELIDAQLEQWRQDIRRQYPEADEYEVRMRVGSKHLPRELMIAAYGWDPVQHDAHRDPNYCDS